MNDRTVTRAQFAAAIFTGLLSPLLRVLPRAGVLLAGKAAWLSVVPAAALLLALAALMGDLMRRMRPGEGMGGLILRAAGPGIGRFLLILYAAWFLFYAGFILRSGAERLTATVYQQSRTDPFILVMLALCLVASLGTLRAAARTAVILRAVLLIALGTAAVFALSNVSMGNLFPISWGDAPDIAMGALPVVTVGGVAAFFAFLDGYAAPAEEPFQWMLAPLALFSAAAAALCFSTVGVFGPKLTARLSHPFFTMTRDVSLFDLNQRIEAVVIALWIFADFILCTLLMRCAFEALREIFRLPRSEELPMSDLRRGRFLLWLEAGAVWLAARYIAPSSVELTAWTERRVPFLVNCFVFGGFGLIWLLVRLRHVEKTD